MSGWFGRGLSGRSENAILYDDFERAAEIVVVQVVLYNSILYRTTWVTAATLIRRCVAVMI